MNIAIIGMGGVGGYFGGKLAHYIETAGRKELKIYFIARNRHLEAIREKGLILNTAEEGDLLCTPTLATDDFTQLPLLDLVLICVKSYDLPGVLRSLKPLIKQETLILPLLNGVDIRQRIRDRIEEGYLFPSCAYVGTRIESYGRVTQRGGSCTILTGPDPQKGGGNSKTILRLFEEAKIKYEYLDDPRPELWKKYIFIAGFGMVTAALDKSIGEAMEDDGAAGDVKKIMTEIREIARALSINLEEDIVERSFSTGANFPRETKTSFHRDFENSERPDERDLFGDTIERLGKDSGIPTPTASRYRIFLEEKKIATLP